MPQGYNPSFRVMPLGHKLGRKTIMTRLMPLGHNPSTRLMPQGHKVNVYGNFTFVTWPLVSQESISEIGQLSQILQNSHFSRSI